MLKGLEPYLRRHAWQWLVGFAASAGGVACNLSISRLLGWAIDDLRTGSPPGAGLARYAGLMVLAALGSGLLIAAMRRLGGSASRQVAYELRRDLFERLTLLEPAYFHKTRTGDLMNRFTGDLQAVQEMLGFGAMQGINTSLTLVLTLSYMLRLSPRLGLVVLGVFPIIVALLVVLLRAIARRYARVQEQLSTISARAQENFSGIRVVKGYAIEDREVRDYRALNDEYQRRVLRLARLEGPLWATVGLLMNLVFASVMVLGARQLLRGGGTVGGLTLGGFITFTTLLFQLSWPMLAVGLVSNMLQRGVVSWGRLRELLTVEPAIRDGAGTDASVRAVQGELRFEEVTLTLEGRTLLDHVNLHVPAGRTLGLTGRTGAGKTLLASLVGRLVDPTSGCVRVDGRDVRTLPLAVLRGAVAAVPQEPFLFSATLAENIGFGLPESLQADHDATPDPERVRWAAEVAGLDGDVAGFPDQYQTLIGERGVTLSGGQRQRSALARAVAKRPQILILDDAMSAVDTETEARILSRLKTVLAGRTVLLIGHRVSTLRHADEIVVLEQGKVVEQGTHEALIALGGRYAELDRKQLLARALEKAEG